MPDTQQSQSSPLTVPSPGSLDELFHRDPLSLSDVDVTAVVTELRSRRAIWQQAESEGKTKAPKAAAPDNLSLDDLGL